MLQTRCPFKCDLNHPLCIEFACASNCQEASQLGGDAARISGARKGNKSCLFAALASATLHEKPIGFGLAIMNDDCLCVWKLCDNLAIPKNPSKTNLILNFAKQKKSYVIFVPTNQMSRFRPNTNQMERSRSFVPLHLETVCLPLVIIHIGQVSRQIMDHDDLIPCRLFLVLSQKWQLGH